MRLIEAQRQVAAARSRHGVSDAEIARALAASDPDNGVDDGQGATDIYLSSLTRFVEALGGRVEVHAVFPEETVTLVPAPD